MLNKLTRAFRNFVFLFNPLFINKHKRLNTLFYIGLLMSVLLGASGAAGDSSWHFSRFFDEFALPHNIAISGNVLDVCLLIFAFINRKRLSRGELLGLKLNAVAIIFLIIDIPLDLLNHLTFGIDLTTWSPTHLVLFYQGCLAIFGMMLAWVSSRPGQGRLGWILTLLFGSFFVSSLLFPLYQQEYAARVFYSLKMHQGLPWYITPELLHEAGNRVQNLLTNWTPDWLYVAYQAPVAIFGIMLSTLMVTKNRVVPKTALLSVVIAAAITAGYLLYRMGAREVLAHFGLPTAELPVWLAPAAIIAGLTVPLAQRLLGDAAAKGNALVASVALPAAGALAGGLLFAMLYAMRADGQITPTAPLYILPMALTLSALAPLAAVATMAFVNRAAK